MLGVQSVEGRLNAASDRLRRSRVQWCPIAQCDASQRRRGKLEEALAPMIGFLDFQGNLNGIQPTNEVMLHIICLLRRCQVQDSVAFAAANETLGGYVACNRPHAWCSTNDNSHTYLHEEPGGGFPRERNPF